MKAFNRRIQTLRQKLTAPFRGTSTTAALNENGFTLIEMMIVVTIIAIIGALVGVNVSKRLDEARVSTTKTQIRQLLLAVEDYKRVCGNFPSPSLGLEALVKRPGDCKNWEEFIQGGKLPKDAWDNDFIYSLEGQKVDIKSMGADKKEGGDGVDKDITSSDL